jgi:hypothetical protein
MPKEGKVRDLSQLCVPGQEQNTCEPKQANTTEHANAKVACPAVLAKLKTLQRSRLTHTPLFISPPAHGIFVLF